MIEEVILECITAKIKKICIHETVNFVMGVYIPISELMNLLGRRIR